MNYLIKWQFTKENSIPLKTQADIIKENLIPLVEDKSFQEKRFSFFITKVYLTNVRLAVYFEEKNLEEIKNVVSKYTKSLKLNPEDPNDPNKNNGWDGCPKEEKEFTFSKDTTNCTEIFYTKYLEDITYIGIDLHKKDLSLATPVAIETAYKTMRIMVYQTKNDSLRFPIWDTQFYEDNKKLLDSYFTQNSEWYKNKSEEEINNFWSKCGFYFQDGSTWGPHFYYDIVLGLDPFNYIDPVTTNQKTRLNLPLNLSPCETFLNYIINILRIYNLNTNFPAGITCSQAIIHLINQALTHN